VPAGHSFLEDPMPLPTSRREPADAAWRPGQAAAFLADVPKRVAAQVKGRYGGPLDQVIFENDMRVPANQVSGP
jgi:hypothetical protein